MKGGFTLTLTKTIHMCYPFGFVGGFGWIMMVLWWALIIAALIALFRWLVRRGSESMEREPTPLSILEQRYAKGEIDTKEFEDRKRALSGKTEIG